MKLHLAIVITSMVNLISVIFEQELSWRKWCEWPAPCSPTRAILPQSPFTRCARYLSDLYPFGSTRGSDNVANTLKIISSVITVVLEAMLVYMYGPRTHDVDMNGIYISNFNTNGLSFDLFFLDSFAR